MSQNTAIEWTDATWNPVRGCSRVSEGCRNCYAERQAARFSGVDYDTSEADEHSGGIAKPQPFHGFVHIVNGHPAWTGKVELVEKHLKDPLRWNKPQRVFVNSMSDLFHEALSLADIARVFCIMDEAEQHVFQILTKRAARLPEALRAIRSSVAENHERWDGGHFTWPLPNVWIGVSVEDQENKTRIELLRQTPAVGRFLSLEPLLEDLGELDLTGIHWVIVGGESGPGARPMPPEWVRSIRDQCQAAGVPFFFKQYGQWSPVNNTGRDRHYKDVPVGDGSHHRMFSVGKKAAGALLDGQLWREFP